MRSPAPFFISYAHKDSPDVERFRDVFEPLLESSSGFAFCEWMDQLILPGERWLAEIRLALDRSRFGLLLVSPRFLGSEFITQTELPVLLDKPTVVPVALHHIAFDGSMDLKGLDNRQVFRDSKGRTFDACRTMQGRRQFAAELFSQIDALLRKYPC